MRSLPLLTPRPPSALSRLTIALALVLGAALAWAVIVELRFQRRTAERVTEDYLSLLAHERLGAASTALRSGIAAEIGAQVGGTMGSVYEELPPPAPREVSSGALRCADGVPLSHFRVDLRNRAFLSSPPATADSLAWVQQLISAELLSSPLSAGTFQARMSRGRAVIVGVKYAPYNAPVAVYGIVTCRGALSTLIAGAHARGAADSVIALSAIIGTDTLLSSGNSNARALALEDVAGIRLTASPAFARPFSGVVIERDGVPSLALALMLLGTVALGSVGVMQLVRDRRAVRRQAELIMTISHELRTPLAQILLYSETLALDRVRGDDAKRAAAQRIVDEARHLIETVGNVIGFTRGAAASPAESQTTFVAPVIETAITRVRALSDARARIAVSVVGAPRVRLGDSALLQTLTNVLDNALKFGPPTQTVLVSAARVEALVRMAIEDEGPGIPLALRERVFERYFRANDAASEDGAGIGLWVVRDIVKNAGGCVRAETSNAGGARIVIDLPAADDS